MSEKLVRWIIFGVIIGLLPILFDVIRNLTRGQQLRFNQISSRGELLLVSAVISASAIGELIASGNSLIVAKLVSGGSCVVMLFFSSLCFADISSELSNDPSSLIPNIVSKLSFIVFFWTVVVSGISVALGEL